MAAFEVERRGIVERSGKAEDADEELDGKFVEHFEDREGKRESEGGRGKIRERGEEGRAGRGEGKSMKRESKTTREGQRTPYSSLTGLGRTSDDPTLSEPSNHLQLMRRTRKVESRSFAPG